MENNIQQSRFERHNKKRKTNLILNISIVIVLALILIIGTQLLFGGKKEEVKTNNETTTQPIKTDPSEKENENVVGQDESLQEEEVIQDKDLSMEGEISITEGDPGSNIEKIIENPNWEPIGTEQTGEHYATYEKGSVDWNEMIQAITYATGLTEEEMTLWRLENNGSPQDAKGTIENKNTGEKMIVYITWINEKGWKPTKIEVLKNE